MSTQFNVRLPDPLVRKVRADARRSGRSLDAVATVIFADFFSGWTASERVRFYAGTPVKRAGRKISEKGAA